MTLVVAETLALRSRKQGVHGKSSDPSAYHATARSKRGFTFNLVWCCGRHRYAMEGVMTAQTDPNISVTDLGQQESGTREGHRAKVGAIHYRCKKSGAHGEVLDDG